MILSKAAASCIRELEAAGFSAYAVGGCVRDSLLGLTPHDYDLCTDAAPEQTAAVFARHRLVRSGEKHGTVGVVIEGDVIEITTFRTEGGYRDSRHPDWVRFVGTVEEDLARRDFTVNAMAYAPHIGYVDPFGGRKDLEAGLLRAVGDPATRFSEDSLRILRGIRFAARYGLTIEPDTFQAMTDLAPSMETLARERVFDELCKLLPLADEHHLITFAPILIQALPELAPCIGFDQRSPHHAYDVFTHIAHVVAAVPADLTLRWAALLHDAGKPACFTTDDTGRGHFLGHAQESARMADEILLRLKAPTALRQEVCLLIGQHMTPLETDKKLLPRRLAQYGETTLRKLLCLQKADFSSKGTGRASGPNPLEPVEALLEQVLAEDACLSLKDLAIGGRDLLALGFAPGPELGRCLDTLLSRVLDEQLPNERAALLAAANHFLTEVTL